ncbi:hypothetical protein K1719_030373 [Acacia pycnantha]|nr:hypothetical protein K1719_030373 [Acacia pycnantha]
MTSSHPRQLAAIPPCKMQQRREHKVFPTSDDTVMMKQVQATHAPDGREVDIKPVLQINEEILIHVIAPTVNGDVDGKTEHVDSMEKAAVYAELDMLGSLAFIIYKISCELSYKCLGALAVNFEEFWLVAQLGAANTLAKSVALLKQLPDLRTQLQCLLPVLIFPNPDAAYWSIRSIVACASQIASLVGLRNEYGSTATEARELSSLAHKMSNEKRHTQAFHNLARLFETAHVSLEVLRRNHVLLQISDLELSREEIIVLDVLYKDARSRSETHYEMVWIPVVEAAAWNQVGRHKFKHLRAMMPWDIYVRDPLIIEPYVIKYIREVWSFMKRAILVRSEEQIRNGERCEVKKDDVSDCVCFVEGLKAKAAALTEVRWICGFELVGNILINPELRVGIKKIVTIYQQLQSMDAY